MKIKFLFICIYFLFFSCLQTEQVEPIPNNDNTFMLDELLRNKLISNIKENSETIKKLKSNLGDSIINQNYKLSLLNIKNITKKNSLLTKEIDKIELNLGNIAKKKPCVLCPDYCVICCPKMPLFINLKGLNLKKKTEIINTLNIPKKFTNAIRIKEFKNNSYLIIDPNIDGFDSNGFELTLNDSKNIPHQICLDFKIN